MILSDILKNDDAAIVQRLFDALSKWDWGLIRNNECARAIRRIKYSALQSRLPLLNGSHFTIRSLQLGIEIKHQVGSKRK